MASKKLKTIILPESYDERVLEASRIILKERIAKVILIGNGKDLEKLIGPHKNLTIIDLGFNVDFVDEHFNLRKLRKPDWMRSDSENELKNPLTFSCMLLKNNFADGVIAGSVYPTTEVLRNAITIIGLDEKYKTVSSFFLFTFSRDHIFRDRVFAYADCGVVPDPSVKQLSDIAILTSKNFHKLTGKKPRAAFLSFSTKGSAKDKSLEKIIAAFELTKQKEPELICDGELQFDAAFVPGVAKRKNPRGKIKGNANVFIFPDLNSGNIAYKITERIGGAHATGPIVQGLAKPVMDLSRGCDAKDIVNMARVVVKLSS